jgi:CBS domain containing-hemolysin-like protein
VYEQSTSRRERLIARLMRRPQNVLSTLLAGNMLVNVAASVLVALTVRRFMAAFFPGIDPAYGIPVSIGVMTVILLFFGEVTPKTFAVNHAAPFARLAVYPMFLVSILLYPLRGVLRLLAWSTARLTGAREELQQVPTREELLAAVRDYGRDGSLQDGKGKLIENVLRFGDRTVREVMVLRKRIPCLPYDADLPTVLARVRSFRRKTLPVYVGSVDHFAGVLSVRDLLPFVQSGRRFRGLLPLLRPLHHVRANRLLPDVLKEMQARRCDLAVVEDLLGRTIGLVTLEGILREVLGKVYT